MERKVVRKWFWVWDFEKEEQWLNEMAESGWALEGGGFCKYTFVPCEPGEYIIRLEMRKDDENYMEFMSELGAEYVGRVASWIYFRRKAAIGQFDLFSDVDSRISHLDKICKLLLVVGMANLIIGVVNCIKGFNFAYVNLLCATVLMYALGRIHGKKEALERERQLHE